MAATDQENLLSSAQVHIPMCETHDLPIDLTCEDCDEFICSQCAKTDHKDHDWKTISTAGSLRRRELKKTLRKVKKEDVKKMEEKIQKATKLMEDNQNCCDSEVSKLQKQCDAIVSILIETKKNFETKLRKNLKTKNAKVSENKVDLEKKREHITDLIKFLEEKHNTMSDYSLIDNLRDLTNLVSNTDSDKEKGDHSLRYKIGDTREGLLEAIMGQTFDLNDINVTERDAYNGDVYATDNWSKSIVRLSRSGSISTVFSTAPLEPEGICQSTQGGLLVTLRDNRSAKFQPDSHSRHLVRHVTLTGDVIREYEYQEDGQTRLFTVPWRVRQNGNTDICVVNLTSHSSSELVMLSLSGSLKLEYRGKDTEKYFLCDVLCDSHSNIIVCETFYSQVHLLSPDGKFLKYLLTDTEVTKPLSMSLYKSTMWVGNAHGLLKVFQYKS
uniref:B box-type domain-containing protein n=1 Tax=Magallana gigas TaxID=29159 RepID=A0A8W8N0H7_MAGGI|nr:uncharacterized protein LOC117686753 [Crassostrea gigas]